MGNKGRRACTEVEGLGEEVLELEEEQCWSLHSSYNYLKTVLTENNRQKIISHLGTKYSLPKFQLFQESKGHDRFFADMKLTLPNERIVTIKAAVYQIDAQEGKIVIYVPNNLEQKEAFNLLRREIEETRKGKCNRDTCREEQLSSMEKEGGFSCIFLNNLRLSRFCSHRTQKGKTTVSVNEITATVVLDTEEGGAEPVSEGEGTPAPPGKKKRQEQGPGRRPKTLPPQGGIGREPQQRTPAKKATVPQTQTSPSRRVREVQRDALSAPSSGRPSSQEIDQRLLEELFSMLLEEAGSGDTRAFRAAALAYKPPPPHEASVQLKKINVEWSPEPESAKKVGRILFRGSLPSHLQGVFDLLPERSQEAAAAYSFEFEKEQDLIVDSILDTLWIATVTN